MVDIDARCSRLRRQALIVERVPAVIGLTACIILHPIVYFNNASIVFEDDGEGGYALLSRRSGFAECKAIVQLEERLEGTDGRLVLRSGVPRVEGEYGVVIPFTDTHGFEAADEGDYVLVHEAIDRRVDDHFLELEVLDV